MPFDIFVMDWPEITKDTPIKRLFEIHYRIWDNVLRKYEKSGIVEKPKTPYISNCALCEYICVIGSRPLCKYCPADWGDARHCLAKGGLLTTLTLFNNAHADPREVASVIKRIRDIKPKEEFINGERQYAESGRRVSK